MSDDETEPMAWIGGGGKEGRRWRWDGAEVDVAVVCFVYLHKYLCASLDLESGKGAVGIGFESIWSWQVTAFDEKESV